MKLKDLSVNHKGYYGIGAPACEKNFSYPRYLRITDIDEMGKFKMDLPTSINPNVYPEYKDFILNKNDIVFARTGNSTGRNAFIEKLHFETVFAGFLIKFSLDSSKILPKYVGYYCQSSAYKKQISSFFTGSTRPNVNAEQYGELEIPLKTPSEQQHIVDILRRCL